VGGADSIVRLDNRIWEILDKQRVRPEDHCGIGLCVLTLFPPE
jgi:hypothetical protein